MERNTVWMTIRRILLSGAIVATLGVVCCVLYVMALFSLFDSSVKEYSDTYKTSYGDVLTVTYEEFNFPDSSSSTELTNEKTRQTIYFCDDPAREWTYLKECCSDENYNVYFFHETFVFVNEKEIVTLPKENLYENCYGKYKRYPKLLKELILDGDQGITCLYAEFYLRENDKDIQARIRGISEIPQDKDPTYYNSISELKFKNIKHSEHGCEEVIAFSKEMAEKYDL